MTRYYTTAEVMERTGVTYRQLDYWIRSGLLQTANGSGQGSGHRRVFDAAGLRRVREIARTRQRVLALLDAADIPIPPGYLQGPRSRLTVKDVERRVVEP